MTRAVRKTTIYVVTLDGSIHADAASAKRRATEIQAKLAKKARKTRTPRAARKKRRAGPGGKSWVRHVLEAVRDGAHSPASIQSKTRIPAPILHPTLSNLRARGLLKGKGENISTTDKGLAFLKKQ